MRRLSPRELKRLTKRYGISFEELKDVSLVKIVTADSEIIFENPTVTILKTATGTIYQILGEPIVKEKKIEETVEISEEDVELVALQAGVSLDEARKALIETKGDLAQAILLLRSRSK
ncbi:MAG: NagC family transcriptional regulator [Thermoprotei archaeon]|nr:MAG: NagC family transcriptional regulator [Thermoprotei archaeon]HDD64157.1 NagC family transcriptional regulator [Thermoprotei archaeon]